MTVEVRERLGGRKRTGSSNLNQPDINTSRIHNSETDLTMGVARNKMIWAKRGRMRGYGKKYGGGGGEE